ncbi:MAG: alpha-L-fucosidase [Luteolibacter sp.]
MKHALRHFSFLLATATAAIAGQPGEGNPPPAAVERWQDARFGMFIHWGPVSLKGTEIGWSRGAQVPTEEYDNLYKQFNPVQFDADTWVATAKAAGMKYLVLTTKHHDGFCLWDTKLTDHNIMNTPFKRDVVKELSEACRKQDMKFGVYYSTCDWYSPLFPLGSPGGKTQKSHPDLDAYDTYLRGQTRELLSNYGPIFTIWFDVPQSYDSKWGIPMVAGLRKLQPDIMVNSRAYSLAGHANDIAHAPVGDYATPEQKIGGFDMNRPWETCMTLCRQWAWKPNDQMKSAKECIATLVRTNGGNGNLLFNVGPMPDGRIEPRQVERLKEMGAWLQKHGESIYGTRGGPWKPTGSLASTRKGDKVYVHILDDAHGSIELRALPVAVKSARILNGPTVPNATKDGLLTLQLPAGSTDPIDTVVELTLAGNAMNIPPMSVVSNGLIDAEAKATASVELTGYEAAKAFDGDPETRWATPAGTKECSMEIDLGKMTTFSRIEISEAFATPTSRVKKFELQSENAGTWTSFHTGTSLGNYFTATFPAVSARKIRLHVLDATEGPTISEVRISHPSK